MIDTIKTISLMIILGVASRFFSSWLDSPYLMKFLEANLINLQITLLAINTASAGIVLSRMREIIEKNGANFDLTISAFRRSTIEQALLIIASIVTLTALNSSVLQDLSLHTKTISECLLITVFLSSTYNLYDNARAIFIIVNFRN